MRRRGPGGARPVTVLLVAAALLLAGVACAGDPGRSDERDDGRSASPSAAGGEVPVAAGTYDVGGHKIFMTCAGTGSPTVVYLHGSVEQAGSAPHLAAAQISDRLSGDQRVCLYDRRNVGDSETVDAVQTPRALLQDLEGVLRAAGVDPPYVLLGASFGGMVAYAFLVHHPDQVAGMVLLDAMFPDELALDRFLPPEDRYLAYREDDACCTPERVAHYDVIRSVQRFRGHEPDVPVVYLAAQQEPFDENDYGSPEYDARVLPALRAYVARFSPGELRWVDAPHFMEPVVPDDIAAAVRDVVALAAER